MMQFALEQDDLGRLVCTFEEDGHVSTVTASNQPQAGNDLRAAVEDARTAGDGECFWAEPGGEYRWMLKREGDRLTVAVMWCRGTIIGWQHVFRSDCDFAWFAGRVAAELDRVRA